MADAEEESVQRGAPPDTFKAPCKFFAKGRCRKGPSCPFLHDQPRAGSSSSSSSANVDIQKDPSVACCGPSELSSVLGSALLCQWRGNSLHRPFTHNFHPRKAVMNPSAVSELLALLPGRGAVLDPFLGSGTTAIEVMLAGRPAVGYDVSPLAVGIAAHHCWRPFSSSSSSSVPPNGQHDLISSSLKRTVAAVAEALKSQEEDGFEAHGSSSVGAKMGGHQREEGDLRCEGGMCERTRTVSEMIDDYCVVQQNV
jgi:hypothetical protein